MDKFCYECWQKIYGEFSYEDHFKYTKQFEKCAHCGEETFLVVKRKGKLSCLISDFKYCLSEYAFYEYSVISDKYERYLYKKWEKKYGKRAQPYKGSKL